MLVLVQTKGDHGADVDSGRSLRLLPVSSEISDLRNFWLHTIYACTEQYSTYQIRWWNWFLGL